MAPDPSAGPEENGRTRRTAARALVGPALLVALLITAVTLREPLLAWFTGQTMGVTTVAATIDVRGHQEIDHHTCSMHPSVHQPGPGKCPLCGMDLTAVTKEQQRTGVVIVDAARRQLIGVRTAAVAAAPLRTSLRAAGTVTYREGSLTDVTVKASGYVTKVFVSEVGTKVKIGQLLFRYFSPEVHNAAQDFLLAVQAASAGSSFVQPAAARMRLHVLGLDDVQIEALAANSAANGAANDGVAVTAPASGIVMESELVAGGAVPAGARLMRIAALDRLWVEASLYEADLARVHAGDSAVVTFDALPGRSFASTVAYTYPLINESSRTGRVRVELVNRDGALRPGMFANVELSKSSAALLQVPASAVVYTGPRRIVFLDLGEGRLRPQEIFTGAAADGMIEVLAGLSAGEVIVTSGVFLLAAEARISTAATYWDSAATDAAGAGYWCPMHPDVRSDVPVVCTKCGMDLVIVPTKAKP